MGGGGGSNSSASFSADPLITYDDVEVGFSGGAGAFNSGPSYFRNRRGSYRAAFGPPPPTRSGASPAAGFFCDPQFDEEPCHFLDYCFLCKKYIAGHRDIFMYRGDTPFCSEECRDQQIEMDESEEKKWKLITSTKDQQQHKSGAGTSPSKSDKIRVSPATGTVVAG